MERQASGGGRQERKSPFAGKPHGSHQWCVKNFGIGRAYWSSYRQKL